MAELTPVQPNEDVIVAEWGNKVAARTVQRYASVSERSSKHPTPDAGDLSFLEDSGAVEVYFGGSWRGLVPTGVIMPYAGSSAPPGWLICNGAAVSRTTYAALFSVLGTAFGVGDGSTTFNLPDLRGRAPYGVAASGTGSSRGAAFGQMDHVHSGPSHTHGVGTLATSSSGAHTHSVSGNTGNTAVPHTHSLGGSTGSGGGGSTGSAGSHSHSTGSSNNNVQTSAIAGSALNLSYSSHGHSTSSSGSHSHTVNAHSHSLPANTGSTSSSTNHGHSVSITSSSSGSHTHTMSGSTAAGGTGATGSANPPGLALLMIIKE